MKNILPLLLALFVLAGCSKNKKYCWKCMFPATDSHPGLDTTVCDMTSEESKAFQTAQAKAINIRYGISPEASITSACYKQNNKR